MFQVIVIKEENQTKAEMWSSKFTDQLYADEAAKDLASSLGWRDHIVSVIDLSTGKEIARYSNLKKNIDPKGNVYYQYPPYDASISARKIDMLMKSDYELCLSAQSGCNATGLINSMKELTGRLWNNATFYNKDTEWVNNHPILQLYTYQLACLTHGREPLEWEGYHNAYAFCNLVRQGIVNPEYDYSKQTWYGSDIET